MPHMLQHSELFAEGGMATLDQVKSIWKRADAICFDVDSTVIKEEAIDELAKFCGKDDQVIQLTKQAMQGNMSFEQSLAVRLNLIQPHIGQVKEFIRAHPPSLSPGITTLVELLQQQKKQVFLISGGFRCLITPVAAQLNIPFENIYANKLKFYFTGEYAGFDEKEPTSRSGGKGEVIRRIKNERNIDTIVHVGDGITDLEASPSADSFIGYGGNVIREEVKSRTPWYITDFNELIQSL